MAAPNAEPGAPGAVETAPARLRLRKLVIHRFMDVKPGTTLEFHDGINVVLGRNGSGKTTLLELISAVVRGNFGEFKYRPFDLEYELSAGVVGVRGRVANDPNSPDRAVHSLEYTYQNEQFSTVLRSAASELGGTRNSRSVYTEPLDFIHGIAFTDAAMNRFGQRDAAGGIHFDGAKHRGIVVAAAVMTVDGTTLRLDEGLDFFRSRVVGWGDDSRVGFEFSRSVADASTARRVGYGELDFFATRGVIFSLLQEAEGLGDADRFNLGPMFSYVERLAALLDLASIRFSMRRRSISREGNQEILKFHLPEFHFFPRNGGEIHHTDLSYGERRLLAIFHYLACNPDVAIIDELVNGLHHSWIERCLEEIGDRQAFLASQNPLLLDALPIDSAETARAMFVLCKREVADDGTSVRTFRHMTDDESRQFMEAAEVGLQQYSEVLRTQGLW